MSPIEERKVEASRPTSLDKNDDDLKRIDLIKQRMELMTEQQELRKLLDQQENMLKEKQVRLLFNQFIWGVNKVNFFGTESNNAATENSPGTIGAA